MFFLLRAGLVIGLLTYLSPLRAARPALVTADHQDLGAVLGEPDIARLDALWSDLPLETRRALVGALLRQDEGAAKRPGENRSGAQPAL